MTAHDVDRWVAAQEWHRWRRGPGFEILRATAAFSIYDAVRDAATEADDDFDEDEATEVVREGWLRRAGSEVEASVLVDGCCTSTLDTILRVPSIEGCDYLVYDQDPDAGEPLVFAAIVPPGSLAGRIVVFREIFASLGETFGIELGHAASGGVMVMDNALLNPVRRGLLNSLRRQSRVERPSGGAIESPDLGDLRRRAEMLVTGPGTANRD